MKVECHCGIKREDITADIDWPVITKDTRALLCQKCQLIEANHPGVSREWVTEALKKYTDMPVSRLSYDIFAA